VLACLDAIKVVEYERGGARILQTTEIRPEAAKALKALRIPAPPRIHHVQASPKP